MGMNSGLFDSPNGRHSERSYQITRKKKVRAVTHYTFISVSATRLFRPFWPIKHRKKKWNIIGAFLYWSGLGGIGIDKKKVKRPQKKLK